MQDYVETTCEPREPNEDISEWMQTVQRAILVNHTLRSPECKHGKCDLKLPLPDENGFLGQEPVEREAA